MKTLIAALSSMVVASSAVAEPVGAMSAGGGKKVPWRLENGYRILDLSKLPLVIDEPGRYALKRDWNVDLDAPGPVLDIVANRVSIDFRGFAIAFGNEGTGVKITGDDVELRNGSLFGDIDVTGLSSTGARTTLDRMRIGAYEALDMRGRDARVVDSAMGGRFGSTIETSAVIERNTFTCGAGGFCLYLADNARVLGNTLGRGLDGAVRIEGDRNLLVGNIVDFSGFGGGTAFDVEGDQNVFHNNTVSLEPSRSAVFSINGSGNVVDSTVTVSTTGERAGNGIQFLKDGNFHGDNRFGGVLEAVVPNGTTQVDWGGTVAY
jgi:hypothetical protein